MRPRSVDLTTNAESATGQVLAVVPGVTATIVLALGWVLVGLLVTEILQRRGHDRRSVIGLAAVLGPFFVPLAVDMVRRREPAAQPVRLGAQRETPVRRPRVVLGVLGDASGVTEALAFLRRLPDVGSVTLVRPIDYEAAARPEWDDAKAEGEQVLNRAAESLGDYDVEALLVPGTAGRALLSIAQDRADLMVIAGDRSYVDLGELGDCPVPVVVLPIPAPRR
ncbi:MAG TPA: hypothetical protein VGA36_05245 [Nitriliruptorales bacterium]